LCNNKVLQQQHSVGIRDQGLSLYKAFRVTGHQSLVNRLQELPVQCQVVKTLAVHCHSDICSSPGGHSAGCRTSWVCLQHHATVVTSNGVTVCCSKFPPTVSKHCQHHTQYQTSNMKYQQSQLL